jgi:hypothetical protein
MRGMCGVEGGVEVCVSKRCDGNVWVWGGGWWGEGGRGGVV